MGLCSLLGLAMILSRGSNGDSRTAALYLGNWAAPDCEWYPQLVTAFTESSMETQQRPYKGYSPLQRAVWVSMLVWKGL